MYWTIPNKFKLWNSTKPTFFCNMYIVEVHEISCGNCPHQTQITQSEHTYSEEPWKYKRYHQACHQEITEWVATPTASLWSVVGPSVSIRCPPLVPFLNNSALYHTSNINSYLAAYFTEPAPTYTSWAFTDISHKARRDKPAATIDWNRRPTI